MQEFFSGGGGSKAYMPKKVPNIQRIINNDIVKIVNTVFSRGAVASPAPTLCTALILWLTPLVQSICDPQRSKKLQ